MAEMCGAIDPGGEFMCDRESGHDGDHDGFEMPTVSLDEPALSAHLAPPDPARAGDTSGEVVLTPVQLMRMARPKGSPSDEYEASASPAFRKDVRPVRDAGDEEGES